MWVSDKTTPTQTLGLPSFAIGGEKILRLLQGSHKDIHNTNPEPLLLPLLGFLNPSSGTQSVGDMHYVFIWTLFSASKSFFIKIL